MDLNLCLCFWWFLCRQRAVYSCCWRSFMQWDVRARFRSRFLPKPSQVLSRSKILFLLFLKKIIFSAIFCFWKKFLLLPKLFLRRCCHFCKSLDGSEAVGRFLRSFLQFLKISALFQFFQKCKKWKSFKKFDRVLSVFWFLSFFLRDFCAIFF